MGTLTLSIEPQEGPSFQHGFHLGTDFTVAKVIAEEVFTQHDAKTVALKRAGKIVDVFDGQHWHEDLMTGLWAEDVETDRNPWRT